MESNNKQHTEDRRCTIRFTKFESMEFDKLREKYKFYKASTLIKKIIFSKEIHVVTHDESLYKVIEVLSDVLYQYRKIGVNYNQSVKYMQRIHGEKAAREFLQRMAQNTAELVGITENITPVVEALKEKYLANDK
jgi:hypothetical protein